MYKKLVGILLTNIPKCSEKIHFKRQSESNQIPGKRLFTLGYGLIGACKEPSVISRIYQSL